MEDGPGIRWKEPMSLDELVAQMAGLLEFIDRQVRMVPVRYTREGAVQSMLATDAGDLFSVVDREAVIGFQNQEGRRRCYDEVGSRLEQPLRRVLHCQKWATKIPRFGGELDLLAVGHDGELLVIEVKPGSSKLGITWAALQATFYAGLFRKWVEFVGDDEAKVTIERMLRQRIELGLSDEPKRELNTPMKIKPIVAIGGEAEHVGLERLFRVQDGLVDSGVGYDELEVWKVELRVSRQRIGIQSLS